VHFTAGLPPHPPRPCAAAPPPRRRRHRAPASPRAPRPPSEPRGCLHVPDPPCATPRRRDLVHEAAHEGTHEAPCSMEPAPGPRPPAARRAGARPACQRARRGPRAPRASRAAQRAPFRGGAARGQRPREDRIVGQVPRHQRPRDARPRQERGRDTACLHNQRVSALPTPPPLPRTNRTSLVPPLVLSGHAAPLLLDGAGRRGRCVAAHAQFWDRGRGVRSTPLEMSRAGPRPRARRRRWCAH
jgi:hypothetical protein